MTQKRTRIRPEIVLVSFIILDLLIAVTGYVGYTSYGRTYTGIAGGGVAGPVSLAPNETSYVGGAGYGSSGILCISVNSTTTPFSVLIQINATHFNLPSSSNKFHSCSEHTNPKVDLTLTNLSNKTAEFSWSISFDYSVFRSRQMECAPLFTIVPLFLLLLLSAPIGRVGQLKTKIFDFVYFLGILPFLTTFMIIQLSMIAHSASGGQYFEPLQYFSFPLSYFTFFLTPSSTSLLDNYSLLFGATLTLGSLSLMAFYVVYQIFKRTSQTLTSLLSRHDAIGLLSYYYLASGLLAVIVTGIQVYGPADMVHFISVPYVEPIIPILTFLGLSRGPIQALYAFEWGIIVAILVRIWVQVDHDFPRASFTKTLTIASFFTLLVLYFSAQVKENYYTSLALFGFTAIPFFVTCMIVAMLHLIIWKSIHSPRFTSLKEKIGMRIHAAG
ncbi:MAG: hypothetical protein ABSA92_06480 [Candidatus Bathyarchaeia archaeon]